LSAFPNKFVINFPVHPCLFLELSGGFARYNCSIFALIIIYNYTMILLPVSTTKKNICHDITEILLKVALNTITLTANPESNI
jgi:hypothetical protein